MNFYTPADPNLIGSQAVPFLQTCLGMVAQVAMLAGTSEESIRRHFSVHAPHFDAIVRILNQTFQLHDPALPAAMGTGDLTQTVQTATSEPEPDYCTDHDPANGIYNPYRNEDTCHLDYMAAMRKGGSAALDADQGAQDDNRSGNTRPHDYDRRSAFG
jgi:hypothetical protein